MAPRFPASQRLGRRFFQRSTAELARDLVGCVLVSRRQGGIEALRLVEVEAYLGPGRDPASHAHRGRTPRSDVMFETSGRLYVYFIYGMHHCANVVGHPQGDAGAVLLRAAEPLAGEEAMRSRRPSRGTGLSNGPAKLCQALGIDLDWNRLDLVRGPVGLWPGSKPRRIAVSRRVGIRLAAQRRLRFFDPESSFVSAGPPARL